MSCTADRHGDATAARYHGCVCPESIAHRRKVQKRYQIAHKQGRSLRVSAIGTIRRIQALQVMGYSTIQLKEMLGRQPVKSNLWPRAYRTGTGMINRRTAEQWARLYREIVEFRGRSTAPSANHVSTMATRKGWAGPGAWDNIDDPHEIPATPLEEQRAKWRESARRKKTRAVA